MGHKNKKKQRGPSMASLIGNVEVLGLKGCGLLGNKGFDHQSLDGPRSVREPLPGVGVEQGSARLLQQPTESVPLVAPHRRLHQRQIRSVPFVCHRPEHLRDRRCLWDHLRPRLSPAAPVPVVTYIPNHPTQFLPNSAELNRQRKPGLAAATEASNEERKTGKMKRRRRTSETHLSLR
ncbi:hypothetical protein L484_009807 [Morus notabilis]|uniref:Uncharacterized protein n=1 Tax=Morus notabilis TaxID=981085 RepID=W9SXN5_9ROSA|nr:hypothetical protein L484_009807 [Morus notabilis]